MSERSPVYQTPALRMVSRPNGLWRAERKTSDEHGTNATPRKQRAIVKKREFHRDPWQPIGRDMSKIAADSLMRHHGGAARHSTKDQA